MVHPSAYWRIGLEPMKAQHSIGNPTFCEIAAIGSMSAMTVRARSSPGSASRRRSRAPAARRRGPHADPRRGGRCPGVDAKLLHEMEDFELLIVGADTDGDCSPSRSVSSSRSTRGFSAAGFDSPFQS